MITPRYASRKPILTTRQPLLHTDRDLSQLPDLTTADLAKTKQWWLLPMWRLCLHQAPSPLLWAGTGYPQPEQYATIKTHTIPIDTNHYRLSSRESACGCSTFPCSKTQFTICNNDSISSGYKGSRESMRFATRDHKSSTIH